MKRLILFAISILFSCANELFAQGHKHSTPAEKKTEAKDPGIYIFGTSDHLENYLRIGYENDLFTHTDYYYTQGILIEVANPALKNNPVNRILPSQGNANTSGYSIALHTEGFTPTSIQSDSILFGDRPYCGTMFLGFNVNSERSSSHLKSEFRIGIIGPAALGYESQKFIHEHTNNPIPHGWEYQIANDVIVAYNFKWDHNFINTDYFKLRTKSELNVGTEYDDYSIGAIVRIPLIGLRHAGKFRFSLNATCAREWVLYNATLQGGLFNSSSVYTLSHKDVSNAVNHATVGFSIGFRRINIEGYDTWITREFIGGRTHSWGHIGILYNFR